MTENKSFIYNQTTAVEEYDIRKQAKSYLTYKIGK